MKLFSYETSALEAGGSASFDSRKSVAKSFSSRKHFSLVEYKPTCIELNRIVPSSVNPAFQSNTEHLIRNQFWQMHHARLTSFLPELFALTDRFHQPSAAVGIKHVGAEDIFLEQYLDLPIDDLVSNLAGKRVARDHITEVGNLAASSAGGGRKLIAFLVCYFAEIGVEWAVCTGTSAVRALLHRSGIAYSQIASADPDRLGDSKHQWGTYYKHNPCVLAVNIADALLQVSKKFRYQGLV